MIPLGGKEGPPPPAWVMWLVARALPEMRRRRRAAERLLELNRSGQPFDQWNTEWRGAFREEAGKFRAVDLDALGDDSLLAHLDRLKDFLDRGERLHFRLQVHVAMAVVELIVTCEQLLGWESLAALALVTGHSGASSEPGHALDALALQFAQDPAVTRVLEGAGDDVVARLREVAPSAAAAFSEYLERYCHRTISYDPGDSTLFEHPGLVAALLRDRMVAAGSQSAAAGRIGDDAIARAHALLADQTQEQRTRFEHAVAHAQRAYGCREDNIFWLSNLPSALIRYAVVEIGRRLTGRGVLTRATDAAFLEERELRDALTDGSTQDLRRLVARRKAERAWVIAHPGPISYGRDPGPPPDLSSLPTALSRVNGGMFRWLDLMFGQGRADTRDERVIGVPGSPGAYTGSVRVVRDETEFSRLLPGDVLVCPITTPTWSVLFLQAGAVVTDAGGVLAHTAVIAREYCIPAVLATGDGTRRLHDGNVVTVDGSAGTVTLKSS
jgi:phosphohistidine swiveling domain-containing protein